MDGATYLKELKGRSAQALALLTQRTLRGALLSRDGFQVVLAALLDAQVRADGGVARRAREAHTLAFQIGKKGGRRSEEAAERLTGRAWGGEWRRRMA